MKTHLRTLGGRPWRVAFAAALDLLLPPGCTFCHQDLERVTDDIHLCGDCREALVNLSGPVCLLCGCELPASFTRDQQGCSNCSKLGYQFSAVMALSAYRMKTRIAMLQTKRPGGQPLATALGGLLAHCQGGQIRQFQPHRVVPIPMHWMRRLQRGSNCPDTVAGTVADKLELPFTPHLLVRRRKTIRQTELTQGRRLENVRHVFSVHRPRKVENKRILLVDDIMTTGATCNEAAKALRAAGAADIAVAVLARANPWV
ncbi:MAG: phosphoribosyltransferase family protein [Planctomycetales bacterium]